jgi:hypothetical protein
MDDILFQIGKNNEKNNKDYINQLYKTYPLLKDYTYININNLESMDQGGGYIVYVNCKGELKNGGLFIKLINYVPKIKNPLLLSLSEQPNNYVCAIRLRLKLYDIMYNLSLTNNYIFYKKKKSRSDQIRVLLLDSINK